MSLDPAWIAAVLSGIAAVLAAIALLKSGRSDPALAAEMVKLSERLSAGVNLLRSQLADNAQRERQDAEARARGLRGEVINLVNALSQTTARSVNQLGEAQSQKLADTVQRVQSLSDATERHLIGVKKEAAESGKALREEVNAQLQTLLATIRNTLQQSGATQKESLDQVGVQLRLLTQRNVETHDQLRDKIQERLDILRNENAAKLEEMRRTVDEKLQDTLEKRLSGSFKQVSDQLEQVFKSVGEMRTLAAGVGDLSRVLTNVKARGTWAEVWLGNLLEEVMAPEQFERNVEVKPNSGEYVDFAVKLPGQGEEGTLWLPIDAKFPTEVYEALVEASDRGDAAAVDLALKNLDKQIRNEGASICDKYVCPPHTTDFAILYLPTEGLYAEVIRRPGLLDDLQRKCRIIVAGPTVLLAILNSLRMGFRTLAIQKRSSEVWQLLAAVKTEFGKYGEVLDRVQKKLTEASNQIENELSRRKRVIDRKLRGVEQMPDLEAQQLLQIEESGRFDEEIDAAELAETSSRADVNELPVTIPD